MHVDRRLFFAFTSALAVAAVSCHDHPAEEHSGTEPHSSPYATCDAIIKACHPYDVGEGTVNQCHSLAHEATSDGACVARKDECLQACASAAADAGAGGDGG